jgi:DNA-binding NarL/FixJ family response regulator
MAQQNQEIPDVVIMDISMRLPDEGIQATRLLHDMYPEIKVVMFTVAEDDGRVFDAFKAGAVGYLVKNEKPSFIYKTIIDVAAGGALMSPGIALKAIRFLTAEPIKTNKDAPNSYHLSERELEVLRLVAKGNTYLMIAEQLFISLETVKKHLSNIFKKLRVKNKVEAINKTKNLL